MSSGIARAGWDIDLRHGEAREDALVNVFLKAKVEHKSDGKCRQTGNLFVEYRQKGRPSGIATTTADWWAFEFDDDHWLIIPTGRLKRVARRALAQGKTVEGGDHDLYSGVLVPIEWLVKPDPTGPTCVKCGALDELNGEGVCVVCHFTDKP